MQDRFKLKFWDNTDKEFGEVINIDFDNGFVDYKTKNGITSTQLKCGELIQCTGLKDKNGKLIYEGDVVTYEWLTPLGKVWRNDGKYIVEWSDGFCLLSNIARYDVERGTKRNVEIVGNIYENPELLESEVE